MKNPITVEALELLYMIEKKGSLAAAANALYKVPSAVTYTIHKLEQDLGVKLFKKEGRHLRMTPTGLVLLEEGKEILTAIAQLEKNVLERDSGWERCLNIAVDSILSLNFIYPFLKQFYKLHPGIEINLHEEVLNGAWESILHGRADLVIGASNKPFESKMISSKYFKSTKWCFCVPPLHPLTKLKLPLSKADMEPYRFIIVKDSVRDLPACSTRIFSRTPVLRVPTIQDKMLALSSGLGVGFLPEARAKELKEAGKVEILAVDHSEETDLFLVWKTANKGKSLKWFISHLLKKK